MAAGDFFRDYIFYIFIAALFLLVFIFKVIQLGWKEVWPKISSMFVDREKIKKLESSLARNIQTLNEAKSNNRNLHNELDNMNQELEKTLSENKTLKAEVEKSPLNDIKSEKAEKSFSCSPDYRSVISNGKSYTFTSRQAQAVETLHKEGNPELGQEYILEKLGDTSKRLRDTFKGHPAWGKLIIPGSRKGTFKLNIPAE